MIDILIALGYKLVPVDGKAPRVKGWQARDFTADEIHLTLQHYGEPGVGIKLENLLDFDGDGPDADAMAVKLGLPESVAWKSARGRHVLFTLTPAQVEWFASAGKVKFGDLELRTGISSQSVLPPSGGRTWLNSLEMDGPLRLPVEVFENIKSLVTTQEEPDNEHTPRTEQRPGDVFNESVDWRDILANAGWRVFNESGNVIQWTRPGKASGLSATSGYCGTDNRPDCFYVFSSAAEIAPFECNKTYTKFEAWTLLNFDGDFRAAAVAAMKSGYAPEVDHSCGEFDDFPEPEILVKPEIHKSSISKVKHPRLDLRQFKDPLTNYCLALEDKSAADIGAIWFQIHELLAGFVGRNPHFIWSFKPYYTNGSLFVVGPTATAKKGLSLFAAKAPFTATIGGEFSDDIEFLNFKNSIAGGWQSGQAILTHFAKDKNDTEEKDRRLVLVEEETATLLKMAKMEGSILSQVMRTAYDGGSLEYRVSKLKGAQSTVRVDDAHVSLIGHITASELIQLLTVGADQTGELNRIQFILCLDSKFVPESKANFLLQDVEELTTLRGHILQCRSWAQNRRITFSDDLAQLLDEYTEKHDLGLRAGREKPINARLPLYLRKWIARFAVLDTTEVANITHYTKAMAVIEYLHAANDYLLGEWLDGVDKDSIDKAILTLQESPAGVTRAVIGKELFGTHWTVDKVEGVLTHARKRLALTGKTVKEKKDRNKVVYSL